jgi:hypothetical protein
MHGKLAPRPQGETRNLSRRRNKTETFCLPKRGLSPAPDAF